MKKLLLLLILTLPFNGCDCSTEPTLEERFSCKVDGNLFVCDPDDNSLLGNKRLRIEYNVSDSSYLLTLSASKSANSGVVGIGFAKYSLTTVNVPVKLNFPHSIEKWGSVGYKDGDVYNSTSGTFTLTRFDAGRITGTFQFTAKERGGTKIVHVTDGKFDAECMYR